MHESKKMSFKTISRILILCLLSISFYRGVTGSEPPHKKLPGNENHRTGKSISPGLKQLAQQRVDLAPETVSLLQTVLNAAGVAGLGFLWIKEITAALGTPILAPFLMPPLLLLSGFLLFLPQLQMIIGDALKGVIDHDH